MTAAHDLEDVLLRNGFVRCDIAACNCGSWHARYGLPQRMDELKEILSAAGHELCNENGNLIRNALTALVAERDADAARLDWLEAHYSTLEAMHNTADAGISPISRDCEEDGTLREWIDAAMAKTIPPSAA